MPNCTWRTHRKRRLLAFCLLAGEPGRGNAKTTHVSMLWTVILGTVEWNDLAKVIRADVDRGVLEVDVRVAMLRSGRRNCFAGICIAVGRDGVGGDVERDAGCTLFVFTASDPV